MGERSLTWMTLLPGEARRVHVEAGAALRVECGTVTVRGPLAWVAETILAPEQRLGPEQSMAVPTGGSVELLAGDEVRLVLLQRARSSLWRRAWRRHRPGSGGNNSTILEM